MRSLNSLLSVCSLERLCFLGREWLQWLDALCLQAPALEPSERSCGSLPEKGTHQESWHRDCQWPPTAWRARNTAANNSVTLYILIVALHFDLYTFLLSLIIKIICNIWYIWGIFPWWVNSVDVYSWHTCHFLVLLVSKCCEPQSPGISMACPCFYTDSYTFVIMFVNVVLL